MTYAKKVAKIMNYELCKLWFQEIFKKKIKQTIIDYHSNTSRFKKIQMLLHQSNEKTNKIAHFCLINLASRVNSRQYWLWEGANCVRQKSSGMIKNSPCVCASEFLGLSKLGWCASAKGSIIANGVRVN